VYVLDTNTLAYFFRGEGRVAGRLLATPPAEVAIPAIVLFEVEAGLSRAPQAARRKRQWAAASSAMRILAFGIEEARAAARIRVDLEKTGKPIGPYGTLIAGTAMANSGTLITRNVREFRRVAGLSVENWY